MSFGLQNLGVINQKNAPAIWQSNEVDFPTSFVIGRILIASDNGSIWIDTTTSSRKQIVAGNIASFETGNGINVEVIPGDPSVTKFNLGGELVEDTLIDNVVNGKVLTIGDATNFTRVNVAGQLVAKYGIMPGPTPLAPIVNVVASVAVVPDSYIETFFSANGKYYRILAQEM